jgi:hypothetical protein
MNAAWSSTHRPWPPWLCFAVAAGREGGRIGLVSVNGGAAYINNLTHSFVCNLASRVLFLTEYKT